MPNPREAFEHAVLAAKVAGRWTTTAASPNLEGPFADINADYAQVWVQMDSYGRIHHVTGDLTDAEKRLDGIRTRFRDALHKMAIPFKDGEIVVDGLPGGRNRMSVSFYFAPYGGRWDDAMQDRVTEALNGYGIRDYKSMPKTAATKDEHVFLVQEGDSYTVAHSMHADPKAGYQEIKDGLSKAEAEDLAEKMGKKWDAPVLKFKRKGPGAFVKSAAEHNPDPLTFKAFMSEFKQGIKAGEAEATDALMANPGEGPGFHGYITVANDLATSAAQDLLELAKRIIAASDRGIIGVNATRLVPKMSGILSTLFYQTGKVHGLNKPGGGPA